MKRFKDIFTKRTTDWQRGDIVKIINIPVEVPTFAREKVNKGSHGTIVRVMDNQYYQVSVKNDPPLPIWFEKSDLLNLTKKRDKIKAILK